MSRKKVLKLKYSKLKNGIIENLIMAKLNYGKYQIISISKLCQFNLNQNYNPQGIVAKRETINIENFLRNNFE